MQIKSLMHKKWNSISAGMGGKGAHNERLDFNIILKITQAVRLGNDFQVVLITTGIFYCPSKEGDVVYFWG